MASRGSIYLTTDNTNKKVYVGQTLRDGEYYLGGGSLIKKVINEKGRENFHKIVIVSDVDSIDLLNYLEKFYVRVFNSDNPNFGYNIRPGGDKEAFNHTPEAIEKIRKRSYQPDNRERIRNIQKIAAKNRIGKHCSIDRKTKIVVGMIGKIKPIEIYDKETADLLYSCNFISDAHKLTGVSTSAIKNNLYGLSKSTRNYVFKHKILE